MPASALLLAAALGGPFALPVGASERTTTRRQFCTLVYLPVCGLVDGERQTFSNRCLAEAARARRLTPGACAGR